MYVLIDNYDSFTYNLYQYVVEQTSKPVKVVRNDEISAEQVLALKPEGIIISPGPGRPEDAGISVELVRRCIALNRRAAEGEGAPLPLLGVCLGHQAVAVACGGVVTRARHIVHGKARYIELDGKGLFRSIPSPALFTRYHSLAVDRESIALSDSKPLLEITAWSDDGEIMGLRHSLYPIEGVQFHPESAASQYGKQIIRNFINYRREPFGYKPVLTKVMGREHMTLQEAQGFMDELTEGNLTDVQIAGFLTAINTKGIAPEEIAGCADFFRELGVPVQHDAPKAEEMLQRLGFAFLFAPKFHSAMRHAAKARQELGLKTLMNVLGPLANPAGAEYQLIGVYSEELCPIVAQAAVLLGAKKVMVVHGKDGQDEISVTGPTRIVTADETGILDDSLFDSRDAGVGIHPLKKLIGGTAEENAVTARAILNDIVNGAEPGKTEQSANGKETGSPVKPPSMEVLSAIKDAVLVNAGAAVFLYGLAGSIREGTQAARQVLESGAGAEKLNEICRFNQVQEKKS